MADRIVQRVAHHHGRDFAEGWFEGVIDTLIVLGALALAALFVAS